MFATRNLLSAHLLIATLAVAAACSDSTQVVAPTAVAVDTLPSASVRWNQRAVALVVARQPTGNGQAAVSRILTYLSVAQYRAVTSVMAAPRENQIPSMAAAVGGASAAVLSSFFPLDGVAIEAQLKSDLAALANPNHDDVGAGEALGRGIGAALVARATADNYLVTAPPATPVGADKWVSSSAAVVRSLYGTRPFFLTSASQLRPAAPPVMGSAAFNTALAEVRQIADTRTPAQLATAIAWNTSSGTFTAGALNLIADSVLSANRFSEAEAARVLAFANAAAFDAQIACWDAKFAYWYPRPSQADSKITMAIALPNHPSYPSGHSCMTGAFMGVMTNAVPAQRAKFDGMVDEAGMSRIYGGIHYRFDVDAGRDIGKAAAALALSGSLQ
jgi:membrane-associated phospholipid phosphatase